MGKIMKNGIKYASEANTLSVNLTRAQYDALSDTEKMNGTYYYVEDETPFTTNNAVYGYTPIGTIISVMGNHAPKNYLACNGQVVNIADYPELAQYFEEEFGTINHFGGDGTTTFAVPDLRGEFLRGTGTNSHANQGNGASVGTHQNATTIPIYNTYKSAESGHYGLAVRVDTGVTGVQNLVSNVDKVTKSASSANAKNMFYTSTSLSASTDMSNEGTVKPTNTSVLYCIAYKNIYITPENLYSTEEKVVGEWIDGKPLYQRTFTAAFGEITDGTVSTKQIADLGSDLKPKKLEGFCNGTPQGSWGSTNQYFFRICFQGSVLTAESNRSVFSNTLIMATVQYTKTTD